MPDGLFLRVDGLQYSYRCASPIFLFRADGYSFCLTSKVSHGGKWRDFLRSRNRDTYRSWLHRFVRLIFLFHFISVGKSPYSFGFSTVIGRKS